MLDTIPNAEEMTALIGQSLYDIWNKLCALNEGFGWETFIRSME